MSKQLENKVKQLNARISSQSDELVSIKRELNIFKQQVSQDMKRIIETVQSR